MIGVLLEERQITAVPGDLGFEQETRSARSQQYVTLEVQPHRMLPGKANIQLTSPAFKIVSQEQVLPKRFHGFATRKAHGLRKIIPHADCSCNQIFTRIKLRINT